MKCKMRSRPRRLAMQGTRPCWSKSICVVYSACKTTLISTGSSTLLQSVARLCLMPLTAFRRMRLLCLMSTPSMRKMRTTKACLSPLQSSASSGAWAGRQLIRKSQTFVHCSILWLMAKILCRCLLPFRWLQRCCRCRNRKSVLKPMP